MRFGDPTKSLKAAPGAGHVHGGYVRRTENGKRIFAHRWEWEKYKGPIPEGYDIHHIDGDKKNNAIENLECLPHDVHAKLSIQSHLPGPMPAETRAKISASTKGVPKSEQTKANMKAAQQKRATLLRMKS